MLSLKERFARLEERLGASTPFGPSAELPFGLFVYPPREELLVRRETDLLATRLRNAGREVVRVDLGELMWDCLAAHPMGAEALFAAESSGGPAEALLHEAHALLAGSSSLEPGPLEGRILSRITGASKEAVVFLERAAELFPIYRTSALLDRMIGQRLQWPIVLFYPGTFASPSAPRFMGVADPSPNYRITILS